MICELPGCEEQADWLLARFVRSEDSVTHYVCTEHIGEMARRVGTDAYLLQPASARITAPTDYDNPRELGTELYIVEGARGETGQVILTNGRVSSRVKVILTVRTNKGDDAWHEMEFIMHPDVGAAIMTGMYEKLMELRDRGEWEL